MPPCVKPVMEARLEAVSARLDDSIPEHELGEMLARAEAATAGPWRACGEDRGSCVCGLVWSTSMDGIVLDVRHHHPDSDVPAPSLEEAHRNARFVSHAREDVPRLVAALRALRAREQPALPLTEAEWQLNYLLTTTGVIPASYPGRDAVLRGLYVKGATTLDVLKRAGVEP